MLSIFKFIIFIYSVVIHEISHGVMAKSLGDETANRAGRLTLNPIKHLDIFGSIVLPFFLMLIPGNPYIIGYAKPVPYNPASLNDRKYGPVKVALAGPVVNLILAVLFGLVYRFLPGSLGDGLPEIIKYIVWVNLLLAIFNLMPIPPLDGHWLLLAILPPRFQAFRYFMLRYGPVLFVVFLLFIFPIFYPLINLLFGIIVG